MAKRTSKKREKLPAVIERYLQVLEGKLPRTEWRELFTHDVKVNAGSGNILHCADDVVQGIEKWHTTVTRVAVKLIRMIDYMDESSDGTGRRTVKVDFTVHGTWVNSDEPGEVAVQIPVIAMYEIRDEAIDEIMEMWPRGRLPPTPW